MAHADTSYVGPVGKSANETRAGDPFLTQWANRLGNARESARFGAFEGPAEVQFGQIAAVAVGKGKVLVADRIMHSVRLYDTAMVYIGSLAPPGGGPLETRTLMSVAWGAKGEIVVADVFTVKVFERDQSGVVKLSAHPRLRAGPDDVCVTAGRIFVRVASPVYSSTVISVGMDGSDETLFGGSPSEQEPRTRASISRGRIVCTQNPERVLVTFNDGPTIHAYDPTGKQVWHSEIRPFREPRWDTVAVGRSVGVARNVSAAADMVVSATTLDEGVAAVQVFRADPVPTGASFSAGRLDTFVISAETGVGILVPSSVGIILAADPAGYWIRAMVGNTPTLVRMKYELNAARSAPY